MEFLNASDMNAESLHEFAQAYLNDHPEASNPTLVHVYFGNGFNQVNFSFTTKQGNKTWVDICLVGDGKIPSNHGSMLGMTFSRYGIPYPLADPSMFQPFEYMFYNSDSMGSKGLYTASIMFWLPARFSEVFSAFEIRNFIRRNNIPGYNPPNPALQIGEYFIVDGQVRGANVVNDTLPSLSTAYKKYTF